MHFLLYSLTYVTFFSKMPVDHKLTQRQVVREKLRLVCGTAATEMEGGARGHWVDTWWANGDVSPSQMAEQKCDFKTPLYL